MTSWPAGPNVAPSRSTCWACAADNESTVRAEPAASVVVNPGEVNGRALNAWANGCLWATTTIRWTRAGSREEGSTLPGQPAPVTSIQTRHCGVSR